jgi:hypothetical protein
MTEEKKTWNSENFDQAMKESRNELEDLKMQLQNLMVKFGMRALKTYQAARNEPLRPIEIKSLVKYEVESAIADLSEPNNIDSIIERTKLEWEKQQEKSESLL